MIQARDLGDLDKEVVEKGVSSQDSGLILTLKSIMIFSGLEVHVREREKSRLTISI